MTGPPAPREGPLSTPVVRASTFEAPDTQAFDDLYDGRRPGYIYSRYANPTVDAAAARIAEAEAGEAALLFSSGMAAISTTLLTFVGAGGRVLAVEDVYGGTSGLFTNVFPRLGIRVERFATTDVKALERALAEGRADAVYLETPTNPTLRLVDLKAAAAAARRAGVVSMVDSTFATPVNTRPLGLGVDLVLHSATKYLSGHADVTAGAVVGRSDLVARVHALQKSLGGVLDAESAWLIERGMRTLGLRVARHNANAQAVAERLSTHPKVSRVHYPGLPSHPQHALAKAQMPAGCGGLLAFDLAAGTKAAGARFVDSLRLVRNAASLGATDSLAMLPVVQSHRGQTPERLAVQGITPATVRLGCGIEETADLLADVLQALDKV